MPREPGNKNPNWRKAPKMPRWYRVIDGWRLLVQRRQFGNSYVNVISPEGVESGWIYSPGFISHAQELAESIYYRYSGAAQQVGKITQQERD